MKRTTLRSGDTLNISIAFELGKILGREVVVTIDTDAVKKAAAENMKLQVMEQTYEG